MKPTVIIIGASSGIGKRIAGIYIERGCRVGIAARRVEALQSIAEKAPERTSVMPIDVTDDTAPSRLINLIDAMGTPPDIFINCAGIGFANPQLDITRDIDTVATNCIGFTRIVDTIFNYYADRGHKGHIANITSIAGTRGIGIAASYSASKRFQTEYLTALSQLAHQRRLPIAITDIKPGFIDTPLLDSSTHYPMMMSADKAAASIVRAIDRKRNTIIGNRWTLITWLWRCIPNPLWRRIRLRLSSNATE